MKKLCILLVAFLLLLVGCSSPEDASGRTSNDNKKGVESGLKQGSTNANQNVGGDIGGDADEKAEKGYEFEIHGISIAMNSEAPHILESLGEPMGYFEAESCAFQGMEKIYTYSGFEIHTYEIDGVDHVLAVMFLDDSVSTKEGIYLYSDFDSVLEAYGDKYTQELNVYTYELGISQLSFMVEDNEVVSIEYMAITK